jgi:peptidoglycan/xylan/chitin deacetylase (PgdA/CDA1 family)
VPEPPPDERSMTVEQLTALAALSHAEIGGHTRTHLQLAGQDEALQRSEIAGSVEDLQELLGRPVTTFAYPFGTRGAVGDRAPRIAKDVGCSFACSTDEGAVDGGSDRYWLPRLNVLDWTAEELEERLRALVPLGRAGGDAGGQGGPR